jgi:IclR family transcriptional regulator, acetate operon repressor
MIEPTQGAQAVDRAAALLRLIAGAEDPLTYTQLHSRSGLSKSTVSRLLLALERNDLVRRDGRLFLPGPLLERQG